jgi:hypothetical protein
MICSRTEEGVIEEDSLVEGEQYDGEDFEAAEIEDEAQFPAVQANGEIHVEPFKSTFPSIHRKSSSAPSLGKASGHSSRAVCGLECCECMYVNRDGSTECAECEAALTGAKIVYSVTGGAKWSDNQQLSEREDSPSPTNTTKKRVPPMEWTKEEDRALKRAMRSVPNEGQSKTARWRSIVALVGNNRGKKECYQRYKQLKKQKKHTKKHHSTTR